MSSPKARKERHVAETQAALKEADGGDFASDEALIACATLIGMNVSLLQDLERLSIEERRLLGEALVASADTEASAPLITDAQRSELAARLAHHRTHPGEPGVTFSELQAELLARSR